MLTESALKNPTNVIMVLLLLACAGIYSITILPIQLFPNIERPTISVQAGWRAASPREVESEIIEPIEKVLRSIPGVQHMASFANAGFANVWMEFGLETDMNEAYLEVISRMNRIDPLPDDVSRPRISQGGRGGDGPALIWFFLQSLPDNTIPIEELYSFIEYRISPVLESIPGVANAKPPTGANIENQLQITVDPYKAAQYQIPINAISNAIRGFNDISGGNLEVGRRKYTLRFEGRFSADGLQDLIVEWRNGLPIRLKDIATIKVQQPEHSFFAFQNNNRAISIRIDKENDANTLKTLKLVKEKVASLNENLLKERHLALEKSFDASVFINRAIKLVTNNLFLGAFLALFLLWLFLRSFAATFAIGLAVPISLLVTFIILKGLDRSLNVISLAGLAFAVGMVLDAAIVVLENIFRLREQKVAAHRASIDGATQVWGALFASTLTTVAIFLPVIFLKEVEGQLFADLAITISIAVSVSLFVAVTIVPVFAKSWLKSSPHDKPKEASYKRWIIPRVMSWTSSPIKRRFLSSFLLTVPVIFTWVLFPKMDFLPPVKRDAVDTFLQMPPGASKQFIEEEYIEPLIQRLTPYMNGDKEPNLRNYYILTWPSGGTIGARAKDQTKVDSLLKIIRSEITANLPDLRAFSDQGSLFGRFGGGRSIDIIIHHRDQEVMERVARLSRDKLKQLMPQSNIRINPGLQQNEPELRFTPIDRNINELGWRRQEVGSIIRTLGDGIYLGEFFDGEKRLDIILSVEDAANPEDFTEIPIVSRNNEVVMLSQLVDLQRTVGPSRINRIDQKRSITLEFVPPKEMSLQETLELIKREVEPQAREILKLDGSIHYSGSASDLNRAIKNIGSNFVFALLILFVLMSALFRSIKDSSLTLLAMPMATVGGMIGLSILNLFTFQPLDLLTMIGFIILLGLVVNNAIILVYKARELERKGVNRHDAVQQSLQTRLRPILMSTATSIVGMLPLLLMPGVGAIIYRGIAVVIIFGMFINTIFTLILLPCLLRMGNSNPQNMNQNVTT